MDTVWSQQGVNISQQISECIFLIQLNLNSNNMATTNVWNLKEKNKFPRHWPLHRQPSGFKQSSLPTVHGLLTVVCQWSGLPTEWCANWCHKILIVTHHSLWMLIDVGPDVSVHCVSKELPYGPLSTSYNTCIRIRQNGCNEKISQSLKKTHQL